MRVTKQQAAENRDKILKAAAALFRERGIGGVGVDALTKAAGLTHGSLYSQFGSKDSLAVEALRFALDANASNFAQARDFDLYVAKYLSVAHREKLSRGCALAALASEIPRSSVALKAEFTTGVRRMVDRVGALISPRLTRRRSTQALAAVATMVGAMVLARAVDDADLAKQILSASRSTLTGRT